MVASLFPLPPPTAGAPLELLLENELSSTALFCSVEHCKPPASATTWSSNNRTCDLERSNTLRKGESSSQLYLSLQPPTEAHRIRYNKFLPTHTQTHHVQSSHLSLIPYINTAVSPSIFALMACSLWHFFFFFLVNSSSCGSAVASVSFLRFFARKFQHRGSTDRICPHHSV